MYKKFVSVLLAATALIFTANAYGEVRAFPGAEGWGAYALGGRGGDVYHVTNLNDSGAGSLREGISSASGPRTIVFDVSGLIQLQSDLKVNKDYITIAGQTAPGDGICLRNYCFGISADHVIVRFIRSRLGAAGGQEDDAMSIISGNNIIMDHCSASWSVDEVFSCSTSVPTGINNVTVQWSIISEGLGDSIHSKGYHSYGSLVRGCEGSKYSYHHNLFAHNNGRNPRPGNYDEHDYISDPDGLLFDCRNNVMYNWGGDHPSYDADTDSVCRMNYVGNYAKAGPAGSYGALYDTGSKHFMGYYEGNYWNGGIPSDPYSIVNFGSWSSAEIDSWTQSAPFLTGPIATDSASTAYQRVLNHAGASLPVRDSVDARIASEVSTGTVTYYGSVSGKPGIIDDESDVGGWPAYNSIAAPTDTDQDGMPDSWETANGLNLSNAADRNGYDLDAEYTNLEVYLNSLIPVGTYTEDTAPPTPDPMTWQSPPQSAGTAQITMTSTTAVDASGVEYYFACTAGGGHDSGWQSSSTYIDTGLTAGVTYTYQVKARDLSTSHYETGWSDPASAMPQTDATAPTPDPMTFASAPAAVGSTAITMTATTATDISGVEYYFANITDPNHDSGWQDNTTFTDTGLAPSTMYTYQVKARDKSPLQNETEWSSPAGDTTLETAAVYPPTAYWTFNESSGSIAHDVTGNPSLQGTLQGTPLPSWAAGYYGNGLTFATAGGQVYVPSCSTIDFGDEDLSVSLWAIQPTSFSGQYELFIKGTIGGGAFPGSGKRYELYRKDANFRFAIDDASEKSEISLATTNFCTGNWVHIVAVRDTIANQIRLYADGVLRGTVNDNTGNISQTEPLYLADGVFTNGAIDDVRIYRYALTQEQITEIYNGAGVLSYYCTDQLASDFDENCQVDFYDYAILSDVWTGDWLEILQFAEDWLLCNRGPAGQCWQ